jgi:hypothetical protein
LQRLHLSYYLTLAPSYLTPEVEHERGLLSSIFQKYDAYYNGSGHILNEQQYVLNDFWYAHYKKLYQDSSYNLGVLTGRVNSDGDMLADCWFYPDVCHKVYTDIMNKLQKTNYIEAEGNPLLGTEYHFARSNLNIHLQSQCPEGTTLEGNTCKFPANFFKPYLDPSVRCTQGEWDGANCLITRNIEGYLDFRPYAQNNTLYYSYVRSWFDDDFLIYCLHGHTQIAYAIIDKSPGVCSTNVPINPEIEAPLVKNNNLYISVVAPGGFWTGWDHLWLATIDPNKKCPTTNGWTGFDGANCGAVENLVYEKIRDKHDKQ